jgi:hypothetical protein
VRHLYVLLGWHPALGMAASPAGVLGMETSSGGRCTAVVVWIPDQGIITTLAWRSRLAVTPSLATVTAWLDGDGTCQLAEVAVPGEAVTLRDAAELTLDMLVAEVLPLVSPIGGR